MKILPFWVTIRWPLSEVDQHATRPDLFHTFPLKRSYNPLIIKVPSVLHVTIRMRIAVVVGTRFATSVPPMHASWQASDGAVRMVHLDCRNTGKAGASN